MKAAEGVEHQRVALLTEPLQRLGGGLRGITLGPGTQPEDGLAEQGLGAGNAVGLLPLQPDQAPLTGAGQRLAQQGDLLQCHEAWLSAGLRGSNMRSPI